MSTDQPTPDDYTATARERFDGAKYTGATPTDPEPSDAPPVCACGNRVSADFQRVLAGNDGRVHACPACATATAIYRGAAADPEYDGEVPR